LWCLLCRATRIAIITMAITAIIIIAGEVVGE